MKNPIIIFIMMLPIFASCVTLTERDCQKGNWYSIGFENGTLGFSNRLHEHIETCGEYGFEVTRTDYLAGRSEGLKTFCSSRIGFDHGSTGRPFSGHECIKIGNNAYRTSYDKGVHFFNLKNNIHSLQKGFKKPIRRIRNLMNEMKSIHRDIDEKKGDLDENVKRLIAEQKRLIQTINKLEVSIAHMTFAVNKFGRDMRIQLLDLN